MMFNDPKKFFLFQAFLGGSYEKNLAYLSFTDFSVFDLDLENATGTVVHKNNLNILRLVFDYLGLCFKGQF